MGKSKHGPKAKAKGERPPPNGARPLWTEHDVLAVLRVSRTTLFEYRRHRSFPRPLLLGGSRLRWRPEEVESWLAEQPRA